MKQPIYMDYAAATPVSSTVLSVMMPYFSDTYYNPSSLYLAAKDVARDVANARKRIAGHFGARSAEVIFTAGGTEANNMAVHGIMRKYPDANVIVSAIEHESVLGPAHQYECREASVLGDGRIDIEALGRLIDDKTVLISVMYANNEIGTIQPIRQVAALIQQMRQRRKDQGNNRPLFFHTDACQAPLYLDLHAARLGVDMMSINGGKMYGPKQSGALYVRSIVQLAPQLQGGGQEMGMRSGTENVPGIIGLAAALDDAQSRRIDESIRIAALQKTFFHEMNTKLPQAHVNGSMKYRLPNNVHITIPNTDNERLIMALDEAGVQAAAGSACSASSDEPSHVLKAIGLSDTQAQSSIRFTMGGQTQESDIHTTVDILARLVV